MALMLNDYVHPWLVQGGVKFSLNFNLIEKINKGQENKITVHRNKANWII
jgi:hypothetical protein